eukprot:416650_1
MGTCFTPSSSHINATIEQKMSDDDRNNKRFTNSMILVGTKSSGKTTIHKHLQILRSGKLLEPNDTHLHSIRQECVSNIIHLLYNVNDTNSIKRLNSLSLHNPIHLKQIASIIQDIWLKYNKFQTILSHIYVYTDQFHFNTNISHYIENIDRIMSDRKFSWYQDYSCLQKHEYKSVLNNQDIIKYHSSNSNMSIYRYECRDNEYEIIDCPIPMKKMYYHAYYRQAILFVAALSDYCITTDYNTTNTNAMVDSVEYFSCICNSKWFRQSEMILFLNKKDLFRKRLRNGIAMPMCFEKRFNTKWNGPDFPDYEYNKNVETIVSMWMRIIEVENKCFIPQDIGNLVTQFCRKDVEIMDHDKLEEYFDVCYESALRFIQDLYHTQNQWQNRVVFSHVIQATDIESIERVIWHVQNIMVRSSLRRGALML